MSNEWNDWLIDADDDDIILAYYRCVDNRWYREADLYRQALDNRGINIQQLKK